MYVKLALSLLLPVLVTISPLLIPGQSISTILTSWLVIVLLLSLQSLALLNICTPQLNKSTSRYENIKRYFTKEIGLLVFCNVVLSYFLSGLINIWYTDEYHDNLAVFWCIVTAQYFIFDVLINYKNCYQMPIIRLKWFYKLKLYYIKWLKTSFLQSIKVIRMGLPIYIILFKDYLTYLMQPSTCFNMCLVTFLTHVVLSIGYHAVIHALTSVKLSSSKIEKVVEAMRGEDIRLKYDGYAELNRICKTSYNVRQTVFSLQDGHPVIWHTIYQEWLGLLINFNKALAQKEPEIPMVKPETTKPVGRPLDKEEMPTRLYSFKDPLTPPAMENSKMFSTIMSNIANEVVIGLRQYLVDCFVMCKLGKYILTERPDIIFDNKLSALHLMLDGANTCGLLCCAAKDEDKYGVVQLVLPEILNTVTGTLKSIEQVPLLSGSRMGHIQLRASLQMFLCQISETYKESLLNLTLHPETVTLLHQYI